MLFSVIQRKLIHNYFQKALSNNVTTITYGPLLKYDVVFGITITNWTDKHFLCYLGDSKEINYITSSAEGQFPLMGLYSPFFTLGPKFFGHGSYFTFTIKLH